ncbi:hypothetical protein L207DRAFT_437305, partial [Hyaloscypha variabilis F]
MDATAEASLSPASRLFPFENDIDDFPEFVEAENQNTLYIRDLDYTKREIRLLRFEPGQDYNGPIRLYTRYTTLDVVKNLYEALSYTWNNPIPKGSRIPSKSSQTAVEPPYVEIFVNTQRFKVTPNLYFALCRIRQKVATSGPHPYLWVDTICINQSNLQERTGQLRLMGDIYAYASEVIIWLGEE